MRIKYFAVGLLIVLLFAGVASAVCNAGIPERFIVVDDASDVFVSFSGSYAGNCNSFGLAAPTYMYLGNAGSPHDVPINIGKFPAGTELMFWMKTCGYGCDATPYPGPVLGVCNVFFTGPGTRNSHNGGLVMADIAEPQTQLWTVGFEDNPGGDWDCNDLMFSVWGNLQVVTTEPDPVCPVPADPTCTEAEPCDIIGENDICPAATPVVTDVYSVTDITGVDKTPFCSGESFIVSHSKEGTYVDTQPSSENVCVSSCHENCYESCVKIPVQRCYQSCIRRCSNGVCVEMGTICVVDSYKEDCNTQCTEECHTNWNPAAQTSWYNKACGFQLNENVDVRASTGSCSGEIVYSYIMTGAGTAGITIPAPIEAGSYDVCVGTNLIKTISVSSCGGEACSISIPQPFVLNQGASGVLPATLTTTESGKTFSLSFERWNDNAHTVPLSVPYFLSVPSPLSTESSKTTFDIAATNSQPAGDQTHWANVIVRAQSTGASCFAVFDVDVNLDTDVPTAEAGPDQTVNEGDLVNFDGSGSSDNVVIVSYSWDFDASDGIQVDATGQSASHTYPDNGVYTVTLTVKDGGDNSAMDNLKVTVNNVAPTLTISGDAAVNEGATYTLSLSSTDPGADTIAHWDITWGDGSAAQEVLGNPSSVTHVYADGPTSPTISATATDEDGTFNANTKAVTVNNVAPTVTTITNVPDVPVATKTATGIMGTFTDPGTKDTHTATWTFVAYDTQSTCAGVVTESGGSGSVSVNSACIIPPNVYDSITLTVTDKDGGVGTKTVDVILVIYDPNGGFVTGGGWINSPSGAYVPDSSLSGKATFGFVSKYQKGATAPTGNTQFVFHAANMDFRSSSYQWLVVAGSKAMYKGTGTIDNKGNYGFILSAIDGQLKNAGGFDKFRIKITDKSNNDAVVYDNQMNAVDDATPTTVIASGSIVIHA